MRRSLFVVAVVVVAALTAFAPIASAQNVSGSLEVASKNTTDTDFQNASTLDNLTIVGTGETASLQGGGGNLTVDGFEDNDTAEYDLTDGSGSATVQTSVVKKGSRALELQDSGSFYQIGSTSGLSDYPEQGDDFHAYVQFDTANNLELMWGVQTLDDRYYLNIDTSGDSIALNGQESGTVTTLDSTSVSLSPGVWYFVEVSWGASGQMDITVTDSGGSQVATLSATNTTYTSGGVGFTAVSGKGYFDAYEIETVAGGNGRYVSGNHSAENVEAVTANVTLDNASANVSAEYWDGSSWAVANSSTFTSSGNQTVLVPDVNADTWRTEVDFSETGGDANVTLSDEAILFDASAPTIDTASASPTGGVQQANQTVSVNVSDSDFGLAQGDSVNVTFEAKAPNESSFSTVGSETLSANGTANTSLQADVGGTWQWRATANDSYGESTTSQTFTFDAPGTLKIRNETTPQNLINVSGNATATVTFFGTENVVERPIDNGTVDLTGLPADEAFVAVIDAEGYYSRRIVIPSIYEQETAYLLPDDATAANIVFKLDDSTGNFDPEQTTLFIEKAITLDNSTEYRVVAADEFGASGEFAIDLLDDTRYRLRVMNEQGDQRVLGSYSTSGDALATVPIGDVAIGEDYDGGAAIQTNLITSDGYRYVKVSYVDSENATDELELGVQLDNGTVVRPNTTETISGDVYSETINVSQYPENATYKVYYAANRSGETISGTDTLNGVNSPLAGVPLDAQVASIGSWVGILAVGGLIGIASGPFGALAMVVTATLFTILGTVGIPSLLLTIAGAVVILARMGER